MDEVSSPTTPNIKMPRTCVEKLQILLDLYKQCYSNTRLLEYWCFVHLIYVSIKALPNKKFFYPTSKVTNWFHNCSIYIDIWVLCFFFLLSSFSSYCPFSSSFPDYLFTVLKYTSKQKCSTFSVSFYIIQAIAK